MQDLHKVPFANLVFDLGPDLVQLLVVTPIRIVACLWEGSNQDHSREDRLDD